MRLQNFNNLMTIVTQGQCKYILVKKIHKTIFLPFEVYQVPFATPTITTKGVPICQVISLDFE
jgi:hypothetical protein